MRAAVKSRSGKQHSDAAGSSMMFGPETGLAPPVALTDWARHMSAFHTAWQQEWWGFVSDRLSKDAALFQQLATCKAPDELGRTYAAFVKQTVDDYQAKLMTFAQLTTEMTVASVPVAPNGHDVLAPTDMEMLGKLNA